MKGKTYIIQNMNFAAPYPGNLMRSIWNLEQRCNDENIELVYCFPHIAKDLPWIDEMLKQGRTVYFKPTKISPSFWRSLINEFHPVAIHTHFWNLLDSLAIRLASIFDRKTHLILHHHNTYFRSKNRWKELLKRTIIKSDVHIACGLALGNDLKQKRFKNVFAVENAIDYSRLDSYTLLNRKEFGISDATAICLMFGHDMCRKGVDIAINAIKGLVQEKDIALFVVIVSDLDKTKQKL